MALVAGADVYLWFTTELRVDPLVRIDRAPVVDSHLELARTYAPFVYHAVHPTRGRQDLPAPVDFDGDLRGDNNWENFPRYELVPTLYYAVLETETHWFLTYHLFHPRDWSPFELGLHLTHEGDGENLQVVVDREKGRPVLLFTQAHYVGGVYANELSRIAGGRREVRGPLALVDDEGVRRYDGTHPCVFVESKGHGIYGVGDRRAIVEVPVEEARFARSGLVFRPARPGEAVVEPPLDAASPVPYALESTTARLWPLLRDGKLTGEGKLLDGALDYTDERVRIGVPRYYEGDRFSGPLGSDRGISPFAVDFGFEPGELGALFFDPAGRYAAELDVPEPWSLDYVDFPFTGTR